MTSGGKVDGRDPRVDPKIDDEIARPFPRRSSAGTVFRKVTRSHGGFVFYLKDNGYCALPRKVSLLEWRKWATKAEVINVAS